MKILDLFCKAGGASMGLHSSFPDAEIIGVDIENQENYPFKFIQGDALLFPLEGFDFIWASPPCQAHTKIKSSAWDKEAYKGKHPDLIPETRRRLIASGVPYIIENVPLAPLLNPIILCGSYFNLQTNCGAQLRRHRQFECSFNVGPSVPCCHTDRTIGIFGAKARDTAMEKRHYTKPKETRGKPPKLLFTLEDARKAMGIDWMNMKELAQAIPPAYSEYLGNQWKKVMGEKV